MLTGSKKRPALPARAARPISDVRGSPRDYRRHLVQVLVYRTLVGALELANYYVKNLRGGVALGREDGGTPETGPDLTNWRVEPRANPFGVLA